jgi:predicted O-methyltransferase YrrM
MTTGPPGPRLRDRLFHADPYAGFDATRRPVDLQGWGSTHPVFAEVIDKVRPRLVVEVGSWKGASAVTMAAAAKAIALADIEILCVDTWVGSAEHWLVRDNPRFYPSLAVEHGQPTLYRQFLTNIVRSGHADIVTPFPVPSITAAEVLRALKVTADAVYLDAGHGYEDVRADIASWWPLVRPGGILFGDDFSRAWPGLMKAVLEHAARNKRGLERQDQKWLMKK